jgi:hypothetical protein
MWFTNGFVTVHNIIGGVNANTEADYLVIDWLYKTRQDKFFIKRVYFFLLNG